MSFGESRRPARVAEVEQGLLSVGYLADHGLATAVLLALRLERPLLVEGDPGVGKTQLAKSLAEALSAELVRLQCYEGIEASEALYEWDWRRQLLTARNDQEVSAESVYRPEFLLERPLLRSLRLGERAVLLLDELDRADDEFDAFLLEILSEYSVTVPELGTIAATTRPLVVITSNRTRELHDALTRRCIYHWIDYPALEREIEIIRMRAPEVSATLARSVASLLAKIRAEDLNKPPGAAEAIDWAQALAIVGARSISAETLGAASATVGAAVKNKDDLRRVRDRLGELVDA